MSIKTMHPDGCRAAEPLLDDLVDGRLTAADQRRVEAHVAGCDDCSSRLASLTELLRQVDALPRSLPPASDLWSGIEPRLVQRSVPRPAVAGRSYWLRQAAAAVAFMALGAGLSQILVPGGLWQPGAPMAAVAGDAAPDVESRGVDFAFAEADFLRAKEALWSAVYTSRDTASPATHEVVERNLGIIAGAIRELRAALASDPGNQQLEGMLLAQHRTEIDLLRRLARPAAARPVQPTDI